jgi:hypothetical protein
MATFANFNINDGQATPVAHTFAIASRNANLYEWHDRSGGTISSYKKLSLGVRQNANGVYKVTIKVMDPKMAVTAPSSGTGVQPNPVAAYKTLANVQFDLPDATDRIARKDVLLYLIGALSNAQFQDTIIDLAQPT